jgi:hypothetical protein
VKEKELFVAKKREREVIKAPISTTNMTGFFHRDFGLNFENELMIACR